MIVHVGSDVSDTLPHCGRYGLHLRQGQDSGMRTGLTLSSLCGDLQEAISSETILGIDTKAIPLTTIKTSQ